MEAGETLDKRQRIIDAAIKLLSKKGYHRATTTLIAKEAGVSQGLIFHYFGNKEELFFSIIEDGSKRFREEIEKSIYGERNTLKKLEKAALTYCKMIEKHQDFFVILAKQAVRSGLSMEKLNKLTTTESVKMLRGVLEEGIKQRVIREIDLDMAVCSFFGILEFNALRWVKSNKSFPLKESISGAVDIFIRGIRRE